MRAFKNHYWPIFTTFWMALTFITSYIIAVLNDHVKPLFPFISDTGTNVPESCIFGQMLNFGALFLAITLYIRYKQVELCDIMDKPFLIKWNKWGLFLGMLAALGISLVANFQETSVGEVHFVGAFLAFGIGGLYSILQTYISWYSDISKAFKITKLIVSILIIPMYIVSSVAGTISFQQFDGSDPSYWTSDNKGYDMRLVATFGEWILALLQILYICLFYYDLKKITFEQIQFVQTKYI